jgi:enediyne biosynthesis protein CalE3
MDQRHLLMHQVMLGDRVRLDAYDKALAAVVTPGAVVADIGAGTLALTALALRHGAGHVYAVEADPQMVAIASHIIEASGWTDRVTLVAGDARLEPLPSKVDVIVAEMMGNLGPEEDMTRILHAVARRSLRPGGVVVPERLVTYLAPIEFDHEGWGVWHDGFYDIALAVVQEYAQVGAQLHFFSRPPAVLGEPVVLADSAATRRAGPAGSRRAGPAGSRRAGPASSRRGGLPNDRPLRLTIERPGRLQAVIGYFEATLVPGISLANFPSYPGCNWAVWVWPLRHTTVSPQDEIRVRVRAPAGGRVVTDWRLDCQLLRKGQT